MHLRLVEQLIEGPMDVSGSSAVRRPEMKNCGGANRLAKRSRCAVFRECRPGRVSNRSQPRLAELRLPNGQQALVEINIADLETDRLTEPHPGDAEQPQEAVVGRLAGHL
jgi:hypothetical protein